MNLTLDEPGTPAHWLVAAESAGMARAVIPKKAEADEDGIVVMRGRLEPEIGAVLRHALDAAREALYQHAARLGRGHRHDKQKRSRGNVSGRHLGCTPHFRGVPDHGPVARPTRWAFARRCAHVDAGLARRAPRRRLRDRRPSSARRIANTDM